MGRIVILGAGVMGSAMALPFGACGHSVDLVGTPLDQGIVAAVAAGQPHPGLKIPLGAQVTACRWTELASLMEPAPDCIVLGVASAGVDWAVEQLGAVLRRPVPILMITKGLRADGQRIEAFPPVVARELARRTGVRALVMAIGGPCIAAELAAGRATSVVATGDDPALLERVVGMLDAPYYHVACSADVIGVEVCAAFKNFFALAVGAAASYADRAEPALNGALAHNVVAALFNRAVHEMAVLAERLGGRRETAFGLAGLGDLHVTCAAGRNSRMGRLLGQGLAYSDAKATRMPNDTVEGAQLALALGPTLEVMLADGRLPAEALPLTVAVLDAVCRDAPLDVADPRLLRL